MSPEIPGGGGGGDIRYPRPPFGVPESYEMFNCVVLKRRMVSQSDHVGVLSSGTPCWWWQWMEVGLSENVKSMTSCSCVKVSYLFYYTVYKQICTKLLSKVIQT